MAEFGAALALAGCGPGSKLGGFVDAVTTPITNPVQPVNIYQTNLVYKATLKVANEWRDYCWARPYEVLMEDFIAQPVCQARRRTLRALKVADIEAFAAIQKATKFINENPTLDARTVLTAAWDAVNHYKTVAASTKPATR